MWQSLRFGGLKAAIWSYSAGSESNIRPQAAAGQSQSFSGTVFWCGEANVLKAWRHLVSAQKATTVRQQWHDGSAWRSQCFRGLKVSIVSCRWSKSNVRHRRPQAEGMARPWMTRCFGVAKPTFWRLEGCNLELFVGFHRTTLGTGSLPGPSTVFRCSEANVLEAWRLEFGANSLSVQRALNRQPPAEPGPSFSGTVFRHGQTSVLEAS